MLTQNVEHSPVDSLRKNTLNPMVVKEHSLELEYPQSPNHPKQAYRTTKKKSL